MNVKTHGRVDVVMLAKVLKEDEPDHDPCKKAKVSCPDNTLQKAIHTRYKQPSCDMCRAKPPWTLAITEGRGLWDGAISS